MAVAQAVLLIVLLTTSAWGSNSSCFDHQTKTYKAQFTETECGVECTVTPFFSPDHSVQAYLDLLESATESIDIYTPGFDSWSNCTHFAKTCDGTCIGCSLQEQQGEPFPVFKALLNIVHQKKVSVRLLTNNFKQPTCDDKITPLDWLSLNGIKVKYYQTTTFMHSKYVMIDKGKRTSISSVNFSHTSFTKNREAGVILEDCSCPTIDFYRSVFDFDWNNAIEYEVINTYSDSEMKLITNQVPIPYVPVPPPNIPGAFVTAYKSYSGVTVLGGYTSPDNALEVVTTQLGKVKTSLQVAIYQITDTGLCDQINSLYQKGVNVSLLVSATIVSYNDWRAAQHCYCQLHDNGLRFIRKALTKFRFAHQKYWIIDSKQVHLSTGNWSPSDFPEGDQFPPHNTNINRDLLVSMEGKEIVGAFGKVFEEDWASGTDWEPKYCN